MLTFELTNDWQLPADFSRQLNEAGAKLCLVPNPNAPSGHLLALEDLRRLAAEFNGILLLDEAYVDFVEPDCAYNAVSLVEEFDNVLILRTFSKGYSLAGLRMAYGLGARSLIEPMQYKTKDSFNTDFIAQTLAQAAIEDQEYAKSSWAFVCEQRSFMRAALQALRFNSMLSQSNFILVEVPTTHSAVSIYQNLKQRGILVRYFDRPRLQNKLRITIGTREENQLLLDALTAIMDIN